MDKILRKKSHWEREFLDSFTATSTPLHYGFKKQNRNCTVPKNTILKIWAADRVLPEPLLDSLNLALKEHNLQLEKVERIIPEISMDTFVGSIAAPFLIPIN